MKTISILMPVYNEAQYVGAAIESVFERYEDEDWSIELIIVDDNSTDGTLAIAHSFVEKYPRSLRVLKNETKGKNSALSMAFRNASGSFICLFAGDDLIVNRILPIRAKVIYDSNPHGDFATYSAISFCKIKTFSADKQFDGIVIPRRKGAGSSSGGAAMMTRGFANQVFPLPSMLPNEDTWINLVLQLANPKVFNISEIGLNYRLHKDNSHSRYASYHEHSEAMWKRGRAALFFYCQHQASMNAKTERKIVKLIAIEALKYLGASSALMLLRGVDLRDRVAALLNASDAAYTLKLRFYRFFVGR